MVYTFLDSGWRWQGHVLLPLSTRTSSRSSTTTAANFRISFYTNSSLDIEKNVVLNQYIQHPVSFKGQIHTPIIIVNMMQRATRFYCTQLTSP
ncbi:hypothetical protein NQ315_016604 [Exocentrus adspersus]|uniref:Uncharacterized protein n=1 Tax=Exocentrus adspersus TaxID=1586481 RepID=A0AAV8VPF4_9CUCU|nr:hypothetical protein NQ315_016604 [Exocentrus adspersus]